MAKSSALLREDGAKVRELNGKAKQFSTKTVRKRLIECSLYAQSDKDCHTESLIQVSDFNKNLKNPSADVFALRAFALTAWLRACEHTPAQALLSSLVALQLKTSSEEKQ